MAIVLRLTKGSELTFAELDGNFTDLDNRTDALEALNISSRITYLENLGQVGFDSDDVDGMIDSAFVQLHAKGLDYNVLTNQPTLIDSALTIQLIDSSHVQARQITYNTSDFTDSAYVTGLPVSTFTNDANYLDSATVTSVIDTTYVRARETPQDFAYASLTGTPTIPTNNNQLTNGANYITSSGVTSSIAGSSVGAVGTYGMFYDGSGGGGPGGTVAGSSLQWSDAGGGSPSGNPSGTWMRMGKTGGASAPDFVTLFLRIS